MPVIPPEIEVLIAEHKKADTAYAWLQINDEGVVQCWGGDLHLFGLDRLRKGMLASACGLHLDELFPQYEEPFKLVDLEIQSGIYSTVYLQTVEQGNWIILMDRTDAAKQEQSVRQSSNELILKKK